MNTLRAMLYMQLSYDLLQGKDVCSLATHALHHPGSFTFSDSHLHWYN